VVRFDGEKSLEPQATDKPANRELRVLAEQLLNERSTMTLATAQENEPWAAPVYFIYRGGKLFFLSDPKTRHMAESLRTGRVAVAVFADGRSWKEIRGLQMSGTIREVTAKRETVEVLAQYAKEYPFVREFFTPGTMLDLKMFFSRFKVRLYCFEPLTVCYVDNSIRFGFKAEIDLND
jgi:uncharacterized protein